MFHTLPPSPSFNVLGLRVGCLVLAFLSRYNFSIFHVSRFISRALSFFSILPSDVALSIFCCVAVSSLDPGFFPNPFSPYHYFVISREPASASLLHTLHHHISLGIFFLIVSFSLYIKGGTSRENEKKKKKVAIRCPPQKKNKNRMPRIEYQKRGHVWVVMCLDTLLVSYCDALEVVYNYISPTIIYVSSSNG